jgi:predicted small secreted protein
MVIRVQIASGNVIEQNVMRMANVTAAGAMLNAAKNIAFTGKMNVTGTHTWSQRQTYLRLN